MAHAALDFKGDQIKYKVFEMEQSVLLNSISSFLPTIVAESAGSNVEEEQEVTAATDIASKSQRSLSELAEAVQDLAGAIDKLDPTDSATELPAVDAAGTGDEARAPTPPVVADAMWECAICTLLNAPHVYECTACTSLRPATEAGAGGAPSAPTGAGGAVSNAAGWWCTVCTFINELSQAR